MLPGMELMSCPDLAVPMDVMQHVVRVESSYNPYAIGVVGGRLVRQPRNLPEALATARMLESRGFNFSVGLSQVNRYNLARYGLDYSRAFQACPNLQAGSRILAECHARSGQDWGKSFSCYYSGNFVTGYRHGYVQKVFASMGQGSAAPIEVVGMPASRTPVASSRQARTAYRLSSRATGASARLAARVVAPVQPSYQATSPVAAFAPAPARASAAPAAVEPAAQPPANAADPSPRVALATAPAPAPSAPPLPPRDEAFVF